MTGPLDEIRAALEIGETEPVSAPAEVVFPRGYKLDSVGLWWAPEGDGKGETPPPMWLCSQFEVIAMARDGGGEDWSVVLEFRDMDGRLKREIIGRDELAGDAVEVRRRLMRRGLSLTASRAGRERLQAALSGVRTPARARLVYSTGWQRENYVLPHRTIGAAADEPVLFRGKLGGAAHGDAGSYQAWRDEIAAPMVGNAAGIFAMSAAFAAPLLRDLDGEGGGFHLRGKSSKGKSTLQRVAGSVWGGGGELGFGQSWRHTDNALDGLALAHNDGLLILDEIKQVAAEAAGAAAYSLATGIMKGRLKSDGESRERPSWRVLLLSSGEMSLADLTRLSRRGDKSYAGQELRLLDLPIDLDAEQGVWEALPGGGAGEQAAGDFSERLKRVTGEHYGWAGPMFVERYLAGRPSHKAAAGELQVAFLTHVLEDGDTSQIRRGAQRFALVAAGGELAARFDVVPWPPGSATLAVAKIFRHWAAGFGRKVQHEDQEAITKIRDFLQRYEHSRFKLRKSRQAVEEELHDEGKSGRLKPREGEARSLDAAGWRDEEEGRVFHIFQGVWRGEIFAGMDSVAAARAIREAGYLVHNPGRLTNRVSIDGQKPQFYSISARIMDDEVSVRSRTMATPAAAGREPAQASDIPQNKGDGSQVRSVRSGIDDLPHAGDLEERIAVLEHEAGLSPAEAEAQARAELGLGEPG